MSKFKVGDAAFAVSKTMHVDKVIVEDVVHGGNVFTYAVSGSTPFYRERDLFTEKEAEEFLRERLADALGDLKDLSAFREGDKVVVIDVSGDGLRHGSVKICPAKIKERILFRHTDRLVGCGNDYIVSNTYIVEYIDRGEVKERRVDESCVYTKAAAIERIREMIAPIEGEASLLIETIERI